MGEVPHDYAAWVRILDRFREGDDASLEVITAGTVEWSPVVAERWTVHVTKALEERLVRISKQLQLGLDRARGDATLLSRSLLDARRALRPLLAFAATPCFPEKVRDHLVGEVHRWAASTQESLEKFARANRSDDGKLLKLIRDNALTSRDFEPAHTAGSQTQPQPASQVRGRRVLL